MTKNNCTQGNNQFNTEYLPQFLSTQDFNVTTAFFDFWWSDGMGFQLWTIKGYLEEKLKWDVKTTLRHWSLAWKDWIIGIFKQTSLALLKKSTGFSDFRNWVSGKMRYNVRSPSSYPSAWNTEDEHHSDKILILKQNAKQKTNVKF